MSGLPNTLKLFELKYYESFMVAKL